MNPFSRATLDPRQPYRLLLPTAGTPLAHRARIATSAWSRLTGLLGRRGLEAGEALMFPRCRSIHTLGMRFPIDVIFLKSVQGAGVGVQARGVVVKVVERMKPFRVAWARGADTVVELPAGTLGRLGVSVGDQLLLVPESPYQKA